MAGVPGLDRKINAWLYRHDRPGLQFSSRKSMHLPRSGLKTRASARSVHVRALNSSSLAYPGNLHVTCVTGASRRSGRWTTTWSCTRERSRSSASGPAAIILSSQPLPWRTTTGLTQVWKTSSPGPRQRAEVRMVKAERERVLPCRLGKPFHFWRGPASAPSPRPAAAGAGAEHATAWNGGVDSWVWVTGAIQTQLIASVKKNTRGSTHPLRSVCANPSLIS